ncbi:hypothetical protein FB45DRAFT_1039844 [Roridomyces roridus]|uniref:Uncharacterized protein n=1 Tax=Roridomyces roridus TaxID=1738132 RepID=A0AAD7B2N3_9AGAR|nr:hypothetical protein FB45DRAFT_1039844 [Roridomyces roridus]
MTDLSWSYTTIRFRRHRNPHRGLALLLAAVLNRISAASLPRELATECILPLDCAETGGTTLRLQSGINDRQTAALPHLTLTVGHGLRFPLRGLWIAFYTFVRQPTDISRATLEGRRSRAAHGRTMPLLPRLLLVQRFPVAA